MQHARGGFMGESRRVGEQLAAGHHIYTWDQYENYMRFLNAAALIDLLELRIQQLNGERQGQ